MSSQFKVIVTPEKQNYICVHPGQEFKLSVFNEDENDKEKYGAILYLDGH